MSEIEDLNRLENTMRREWRAWYEKCAALGAEIDRLKEDLANAKDEGFSSATLPTKEAEEKLLKRISDLVWLVRNLSDALDCVYGKLPSHWRELPFSYHELKRKVKEVMKNG